MLVDIFFLRVVQAHKELYLTLVTRCASRIR